MFLFAISWQRGSYHPREAARRLFQRAEFSNPPSARFLPWRSTFSLRSDPTRRRQRRSRPREKLIGFVEQPLRRAPKRQVYGAALLLVAEGRNGLCFLEDRPVVVINPEVERLVRHHPEHEPVAEHARLAEHTPHRDAAEGSELLASELGTAVA